MQDSFSRVEEIDFCAFLPIPLRSFLAFFSAYQARLLFSFTVGAMTKGYVPSPFALFIYRGCNDERPHSHMVAALLFEGGNDRGNPDSPKPIIIAEKIWASQQQLLRKMARSQCPLSAHSVPTQCPLQCPLSAHCAGVGFCGIPRDSQIISIWFLFLRITRNPTKPHTCAMGTEWAL